MSRPELSAVDQLLNLVDRAERHRGLTGAEADRLRTGIQALSAALTGDTTKDVA